MGICGVQPPCYYLPTPGGANALQDHQPGIEPKRKPTSSAHRVSSNMGLGKYAAADARAGLGGKEQLTEEIENGLLRRGTPIR